MKLLRIQPLLGPKLIVAAGLSIFSTVSESAPNFEAKTSLFYMDGSGNPDAPYLGIAESRDYEKFVPRLSLGWLIDDRFTLNASYTDLGKLSAKWTAPQTPPFEGPGRTAITNFDIQERMESFGVSLSYSFGMGPGTFEIGGGSEWVRNEHSGWIDEKEEDWSIAFSAGYELPLSDHWSYSVEYLQIKPPGKTLHLFGGSIAFKF